MMTSILVGLMLIAAAAPDAGSPAPTEAGHLWSGVSGGAQVSWTKERLVATCDGKTTFEEELQPSDAETCVDVEFRSQALSLVGPYFSWYREMGGDCGGAHPNCGTALLTVDLRTGKKADLFLLFGAETVMKALRRDSYIRKLLAEEEVGPEAGRTFESLQRTLQAFRFRWLDVDSFYIHHLEKDRVAVRIGLTSSAHATCGEKTELGLLLPIPPGLKEAFERAAGGVEGFVATNRPKASQWGMIMKGEPEQPLP